jgi:hypothetical protein
MKSGFAMQSMSYAHLNNNYHVRAEKLHGGFQNMLYANVKFDDGHLSDGKKLGNISSDARNPDSHTFVLIRPAQLGTRLPFYIYSD